MKKINATKYSAVSFIAFLFLISCSPSNTSTEEEAIADEEETKNYIIINEIVAKNPLGNDWVELKNTSSENINLQDYSLMDITSVEPTALPDISLAPGDFFTIESLSGSSEEGILPFGLGDADTLYLRYDGQTVDTISWVEGEAPSESSFGIYNEVAQTLYPTRQAQNAPDQLFFNDQVIDMSLNLSAIQWQTILESSNDVGYQSIDVEYNHVTTSAVGLKVKGQSVTEHLESLDDNDAKRHRYNFKLDMNNFVSGQKLFGAKKLHLHNGLNDPTMMREVLAYQLMNHSGLSAPRTTYVDLSLNIDGTIEHLGLYYLVEAIDSEFIETHFPEDNANTGDLYEAVDDADLTYISSAFSDYELMYELKNNDDSLLTTLYGASFINLVTGLNQSAPTNLDYIDTDQIITYFALNTILSSLDNYYGNNPNDYYLYEQRINTSKFALLPWDYNFAFGTQPYTCNSTEFLIDAPTELDRNAYPLFMAIIQEPTLKAQYHAEIQSILDSHFNETSMTANINHIRSLIEPYISKSPSMFYTESTWENSITQTVSVTPQITNSNITQSSVIGLLEFIGLRHTHIQQQLDAQTDSSLFVSACDDGQ